MNRGQLLEEFKKYQQRVARSMIDGGEGKRVPQILSKLSFADFEAGWKAAIEAAGVTVRGGERWSLRFCMCQNWRRC